MKKIALLVFGISALTVGGYLVFSNTAIGKDTLINWLLKKWDEAARKKAKKFDQDKFKTELQKLSYKELELLASYTWSFPMLPEEKDYGENLKQKFNRKYKKIIEAGIYKTVDLKPLENIVLPG